MSDESGTPGGAAEELRAEWAALSPAARRRIKRAVFFGARIQDPATLRLALPYAEAFVRQARWFTVGGLLVGGSGMILGLLDGKWSWTAMSALGVALLMGGLLIGATRFRRVNPPGENAGPPAAGIDSAARGRRRLRLGETRDPFSTGTGTIALAILAAGSDPWPARVALGLLAMVSAVSFVGSIRARRIRRHSASLGERGFRVPTRRR